jgi:Domain of unknown function (DUF4349)
MSLVPGRTPSPRGRGKLVLAAIAVGILFLGYVRFQGQRRWVADEGGSIGWDPGSSSSGWNPVSLWRQDSLRDLLPAQNSPVHYRSAGIANMPNAAQPTSDVTDDASRKIVRTASLEMEARDTSVTMEQIRTLAEQGGGYLESSWMNGGEEGPSGNVTIRVPTSQFDRVLGEIKKLAVRVEREGIQTTDVTRDDVDREAKLHALRAEEAQYLFILKRATTVQDTLDVSSKLNEVRAEIDTQQAEFLALTKQVETVAISVSLVPVADTQVLGIHWRPWFAIKLAARNGLDGLGGFARSVTGIIFALPTFFLWLAFVVGCAAVAVRILRWMWRKFFTFSKSHPAAAQPEPGV